MTLQEDLPQRLADVRARIDRAASRAGRRAAEIRLVAVSKTYPVECVRLAAAAGQRDFGENRVQEALPKLEAAADPSLRWHLVGHLQSNKARKAARSFAFIHSIDSVDLLLAVDRVAADAGTSPTLLVQVDLAAEATKHGAPPTAVRDILAAVGQCRAVTLGGLMLLPPFFDNVEEVRPYFRRLRELRDELAAEGANPAWLRELSMGMSHDFEVAIEEGATIVRVGTAIFGSRG